MKESVFKYTIFPGEQAINMALGAELLHVDTQGDVPQLWARVDTHAKTVNRKICTVGTGHPMPEGVGPHVGTFTMMSGVLVFHVFDCGEELPV